MKPSKMIITDWDREDSAFPRWQLVVMDDTDPYYPQLAILNLRWNTRDDGK